MKISKTSPVRGPKKCSERRSIHPTRTTETSISNLRSPVLASKSTSRFSDLEDILGHLPGRVSGVSTSSVTSCVPPKRTAPQQLVGLQRVVLSARGSSGFGLLLHSARTRRRFQGRRSKVASQGPARLERNAPTRTLAARRRSVGRRRFLARRRVL